jgi:hypothetical protein
MVPVKVGRIGLQSALCPQLFSLRVVPMSSSAVSRSVWAYRYRKAIAVPGVSHGWGSKKGACNSGAAKGRATNLWSFALMIVARLTDRFLVVGAIIPVPAATRRRANLLLPSLRTCTHVLRELSGLIGRGSRLLKTRMQRLDRCSGKNQAHMLRENPGAPLLHGRGTIHTLAHSRDGVSLNG